MKLTKNEQLLIRWRIAEDLGYKPKTNIWDIFSITKTDELGKKYEEVLEDIKKDIEIVAELALVLNHQSWDNAEFNDVRSEKFIDLYYKLRDYVYGNSEYTKEELRKFFEITD